MDTPKTTLGAKTFLQRSWAFSRELWSDHDFWIHALAVKGGASAVVVAGIAGITYVVALPFFIAAVGIAACGALIGLGLYGIFAGTANAYGKLKRIYYKTFFHARPPEKRSDTKPLHRKFVENVHIEIFLGRPLPQKLFNSRVWKMTGAITKKQRDIFLTGLAGTGSLFWAVMSALTLITQIVVLPVVALGSVLTFGVALAVGGLLSAAYGLYISINSLLRFLHIRKDS